MSKPIILHLGGDIKWNFDLYKELQNTFEIERSHSMSREEFKQALQSKRFYDIHGVWRPFPNTGGEMGMFDAELIDLLPSSCKIFGFAMAGYEHVDVKLLAERGIIYCNSAAACTESVADAAIYLIISTFRHYTRASLAARSLDPDMFNEVQTGLPWTTCNPSGHTLGIIGLGRIGQRIAQKAHVCFPMKIVYNDIQRLPDAVEKETDAVFYENLDDMLAVSDCVIVATPFGGTKVMDAEKINKMKKGSRLINIARGKLVDEDALEQALKSGHLHSAGLDVHFNEPHINPKLAALDNVAMLCHNAGTSLDSQKGFETISMENLLSFHKTGKALTPVNLHLFKDSAK